MNASCASAGAYRETALSFHCDGVALQGVLTGPTAPQACSPLGVVVVVGGPQYRIGSHRQFVLLARRLAAAGHAVLRFDVRGMGDSGGDPRSFEALQSDIGTAIDAMAQAAGIERVALWGLCDGASASLLYLDARADARVVGLALVNPWVRSVQSLAQTHVKHYYRERLLQLAFWSKLVRGGVGLTALRDLCRNVLRAVRRGPRAQRFFQQRMASAWNAFGGHLLVLTSTNDWAAREFEEQLRQSAQWQVAAKGERLCRHRIVDADHTLSTPEARRQAEHLTLQWLSEVAARL